MADGYVARFECPICQGVHNYDEFCVLNCGHPYHAVCVEQWLEHSSTPTCPSCRAKITKRGMRVILGVESVPTAEGDEAVRQLMANQQQQAIELQQLVEVKHEQISRLQSTVDALLEKQEKLQSKLTEAKGRVTTLEATGAEDRQKINTLTVEKLQLMGRYKTDLLRMQSQLREEERKAWRAEAHVRRMQLTNPHLTNLAAVRQLIGPDQQEGSQEQQNVAALAGALAQRNKELKEAQQLMQQLHEQQKSQHEAADRQLEAATAQHMAAMTRLSQQKEQHMKDALRLEYENGNLARQLSQQRQQLQELKGILHVLQSVDAPGLSGPHNSDVLQRQYRACQAQQQAEIASADVRTQSGWQQQEVPGRLQQQQQESSKFQSISCQALCFEDQNREGMFVMGVNTLDSYAALQDELSDEDADLALPDSGIQRRHQSKPVMFGQSSMHQSACDHKQHQTGTHKPPSLQVLSPEQHSSVACQDSSCVSGVLGAGGSALRTAAGLNSMPSFVAKTKVHSGLAPNFAASSIITGQYIRQGPDGKGGRATHANSVAPSSKRARHDGALLRDKKHRNLGDNKVGAATLKGITSYFSVKS